MDGILKDVDTSKKIKAIMAIKGLNKQVVADLLDVTEATIRNRLNDDRWNIKDLQKIADAYDVNVHDLI